MGSKPSVLSAEYFEELSKLTRELASLDIIVTRSDFDVDAFGSCLIEAEANGKRARVVWDGVHSCFYFSVVPKNPHGGNRVRWDEITELAHTFSGYQEIFAKGRKYILGELAR